MWFIRGWAVVGVMTKLTVAILVTALLLAAVPAAGAQAPRLTEENDKFVLENDAVRVWFQGKKPMLKVFPAGNDSNESAYEYRFTEVVEYRDVDGDGAPSNQEVFSSLNLNAASGWDVQRSESEDNITLNLTLTAPVRVGRLDTNVTLPDTDATVSIVFHIFSEDVTIDNVTVPRTAVKYDFIVSSWPSVGDDLARLALESRVTGNITMDDATEGGSATVTTTNDTEIGALTWVSNATGVTTDGENVTVPVVTRIAMAEEGTSRVVFTYDAPDLTTLVHDPTIGTSGGDPSESGAENGNGVPGAGMLIVAVVAVAAIVARRR